MRESSPIRHGFCKKQMRLTLAVTAAKALYRSRVRHPGYRFRPAVLESSRCMAVPGQNRRHKLSKIIDMPMFGFSLSAMPQNASRYTARTEGTSDIQVIAGFDVEKSPAADLRFSR